MREFAFLLLFLPFAALAQAPATKGIHFEEKLSWSAIQAKAKAENKYIFMDCFTTWCGPCRYMANTIFPMQESGDYFNDKFISVAVQLDTTAKDNAAVKAWYADAHAIFNDYHINAFPTYLIFAPDGRPVHRMMGSTGTAKAFIDETSEAFDTTKQFYTSLQQFQAGRRDSAFLRRLALKAEGLYDLADGRLVAEAYYATQSDLYSHGALEVLSAYTETTDDKGFSILLHDAGRIDSVMGSNMAENQINTILLQKFIYPLPHAAGEPNWKKVQASIAAGYPAQAEEVTLRGKVFYYEYKNDWTHFQPAIIEYMNRYGAHASPDALNDYAWTVFTHCKDMTCVAGALDWSKRSFQDKPNPMYMDTYANILYKMGKKDEAIAWELKASDLDNASNKGQYEKTIGKMRKGEKTWE